MTKLIILNGPPRSGKDSIAQLLATKENTYRIFKYADLLKEMTHRLYNTPNQEASAYELTKDVPSVDFIGLTPRNAYISVSEEYIKKVHGTDFFGKQLVKKILEDRDYDHHTYLITDGGFFSEVIPLIDYFGAHSLTVVPLYRAGCDFSKDSRTYLPFQRLRELGVFVTPPLHNDGTLDEASDTLEGFLRQRLLQAVPV